jgi:hypothetical protein
MVTICSSTPYREGLCCIRIPYLFYNLLYAYIGTLHTIYYMYGVPLQSIHLFKTAYYTKTLKYKKITIIYHISNNSTTNFTKKEKENSPQSRKPHQLTRPHLVPRHLPPPPPPTASLGIWRCLANGSLEHMYWRLESMALICLGLSAFFFFLFGLFPVPLFRVPNDEFSGYYFLRGEGSSPRVEGFCEFRIQWSGGEGVRKRYYV